MKLEEIRPRRINKKQEVFELLRHEATYIIYNLYIKLRARSKQFSVNPTTIFPNDTIYEYIELLESTKIFILEKSLQVPQSTILLNDLLEYLDIT